MLPFVIAIYYTGIVICYEIPADIHDVLESLEENNIQTKGSHRALECLNKHSGHTMPGSHRGQVVPELVEEGESDATTGEAKSGDGSAEDRCKTTEPREHSAAGEVKSGDGATGGQFDGAHQDDTALESTETTTDQRGGLEQLRRTLEETQHDLIEKKRVISSMVEKEAHLLAEIELLRASSDANKSRANNAP